MRFFATIAKNLEPLLADELATLGATDIKPTGGGVWFSGDQATGYKVCLWSRLASSVMLYLKEFDAPTPEALYEGARSIDWSEHFGHRRTFAVQVSAKRSAIPNTHYAALRVKDAIVDQFRDAIDRRPDIELDNPDIRINLFIQEDRATLYLSMSGTPLHRRGWRRMQTEAPLKETLAAAILWRAKWPELAKQGAAFMDPMCGSGTFPIEAWMMAADIAPGLERPDGFAFERWKQHDARAWADLVRDAKERREYGIEEADLPKFIAYDKDQKVVRNARKNIRAAGADADIRIAQREINEVTAPTDFGLMAVNPPYGERLEDHERARNVHIDLGDILVERFFGWKVSLITGSKELGMLIPLRATKRYTVFNGPLECNLLHFSVEQDRIFTKK